MIDVRELRIGNLLLIGGVITHVEGLCLYDRLIQSSNFAERDKDEFKYVTITKEILRRFGFIKSTDYLFIKDDIKLHWYSTDSCYMVYIGENTISSISVRYAHQIQNLCYALNGEELILNNG